MKLIKNLDKDQFMLEMYLIAFYLIGCINATVLFELLPTYGLIAFLVKLTVLGLALCFLYPITPSWRVLIIIIPSLLVSTVKLPYYCYTFLRIEMFTFSAGNLLFLYKAIQDYQDTKVPLTDSIIKVYIILFMLSCAVLFNPLIVIHLDKDKWIYIDLIISGMLFINIPILNSFYKRYGFELF